MKNMPHFGQRSSGELGRKASRKNAMIEGIIQMIMIIKRRLGFLSIRNPRAAGFGISIGSSKGVIVIINLQMNKKKPNAFRGLVPLRRVSRGVNPKDC